MGLQALKVSGKLSLRLTSAKGLSNEKYGIHESCPVCKPKATAMSQLLIDNQSKLNLFCSDWSISEIR